ncbi:MAG: class I SAM-dependent methyltransferase [Solirubrobacteraceae bacterium]
MRRQHLFEFQDLPWFPAILRDTITDLLGMTIELARLYDSALPQLVEALRATGERTILDLCSGGGGPLPGLRRRLAHDHDLAAEVRLSDLYPNVAAFERIAASGGGGVTFVPTPVDATRVPPELPGFRTLFSCFHHFRPPQAQAILRDAWARGRGIGIFEITERSLAGVAPSLMGPLVALALTAFIRPFRWSRLALTYAVPILPLLFTFDGIASNLRTYTPDELRAMTRPLERDDYRWEVGQTRHPVLPTKVTYLLGLPQRPAKTDATPSAA